MMNDDKHKDISDNAEEMFKAATEGYSDAPQSFSKEESGLGKKVIIAVSILVSVAIIGLLTITLMKKNQEFVDKTKDPEWVEKDNTTTAKGEWDFDYPANVPAWTKQPFTYDTFMDNEADVASMTEWAEELQQFYSAIGWIPSSETGDNLGPAYTNNLADEFDEDGELNNQFSYVLKEDYIKAYATGIQRLINPVFGGWVYSQMHVEGIPQIDNGSFEILSAMFNEEWWVENIKQDEDYSRLPIIADWDGKLSQEPGIKKDSTGVYYGVVINTEENQVVSSSLGEGHRGGQIIEVITPVEYTAFGLDSKLKKTGTITIVLEPNNYEYDTNNRVIIKSAELKLD